MPTDTASPVKRGRPASPTKAENAKKKGPAAVGTNADFKIEVAARTAVDSLRQFYLDFNRGVTKSKTTAAIQKFATENFSSDLKFVFFWGSVVDREGWIKSTIEMQDGCPVDPENDVKNKEYEVVFKTEERILIRSKDVFTIASGPMAGDLSCIATLLFVRDDTAPGGVRMLHYQETKVDGETTMKMPECDMAMKSEAEKPPVA